MSNAGKALRGCASRGRRIGSWEGGRLMLGPQSHTVFINLLELCYEKGWRSLLKPSQISSLNLLNKYRFFFSIYFLCIHPIKWLMQSLALWKRFSTFFFSFFGFLASGQRIVLVWGKTPFGKGDDFVLDSQQATLVCMGWWQNRCKKRWFCELAGMNKIFYTCIYGTFVDFPVLKCQNVCSHSESKL